MLQRYEWIADEKKYFGEPNTAYDFKANDPKEAGRRIQKLSDTKDKLSKSVNMRAMNMLGKAEEQVRWTYMYTYIVYTSIIKVHKKDYIFIAILYLSLCT